MSVFRYVYRFRVVYCLRGAVTNHFIETNDSRVYERASDKEI